LVGSAHKFYGPKGIGFLYRKVDKPLTPLICGGSQERNQRAGTENVAGIVGLAKALELCYRDYAIYHEHLWKLKKTFIQELTQIMPSIQFNGEVEVGKSLPTVINVTFPFEEDQMILFNLDMQGVSVSSGSACTSGSNKGSHVLHAIGLKENQINNSIRFSFGVQNTVEEIHQTISILKNLFELQNA
ncbi:MAG: aminotransferase class V-fold PLP-dependent enzyme, partial [Candidatus Pacearchaeota archaeon]